MLTGGSGEHQDAGQKASTNQYSFLSAAQSLYSATNTNSAGVGRLCCIWDVKAQTCCFLGIPSVLHCSDSQHHPCLLLLAGMLLQSKTCSRGNRGAEPFPAAGRDGKLHLSPARRTVNGLLPLSLPRRDESGKQQAAITAYGASSPGLSLPSDGKRWY